MCQVEHPSGESFSLYRREEQQLNIRFVVFKTLGSMCFFSLRRKLRVETTEKIKCNLFPHYLPLSVNSFSPLTVSPSRLFIAPIAFFLLLIILLGVGCVAASRLFSPKGLQYTVNSVLFFTTASTAEHQVKNSIGSAVQKMCLKLHLFDLDAFKTAHLK